jgi:hypothetical protein
MILLMTPTTIEQFVLTKCLGKWPAHHDAYEYCPSVPANDSPGRTSNQAGSTSLAGSTSQAGSTCTVRHQYLTQSTV